MLGEIVGWGGFDIPTGWLECDGQRVSKITYNFLYQLIGDQFGEPGESDFAVPDLRGRAPVGASPGGLGDDRPSVRVVGAGGGVEGVVLLGNESGVAQHHHPVWRSSGGSSLAEGIKDSAIETTNVGVANYATADVGAANADAAHQNMSPFQVVRFIIRAR